MTDASIYTFDSLIRPVDVAEYLEVPYSVLPRHLATNSSHSRDVYFNDADIFPFAVSVDTFLKTSPAPSFSHISKPSGNNTFLTL